MIRERAGRFQVVVYAGRVDGRDIYSRQTVATHAAAKQLERTLTGQALRSRNGAPASTLADLLDRWLTHAAPDLAATTAHTYRSYIERTINPAIGKTKLARLNAGLLDDFYAKLRVTPRDEKGPMQPASIRQCHAIIRRACSVAVRWGWLAQNPAANASPPRVLRHENAPPSPDQIRQLLAALEPDLATFMRLAFVTGARRGELCALRWSDLDLEQGIVTIRRSLSIPGGGGPVEKDTKSHGVRRLTVGPKTVESLRAQRVTEEEKAAFLETRFQPDAYVFTTVPGKPWHPDAASSRYRTAARELGIKARLHDWRHASATFALAGGHPDVQVAHRLGHASTKMTHDVYSHVSPVGDQAIAATLDALLDG